MQDSHMVSIMDHVFRHESDVLLDLERLAYLQKIYMTDITVGACMHVITHHVVPEQSIRVMRDNEDILFEHHEREKLETMANAMLMQIVSWGFVVFTTSPQMRCIALAEIDSIRLRPGENELIGALRGGSTAQNITITNAFDASPLSDGTLTSMIAKIAHHVRFKRALSERVITIENQKVKPNIYCETDTHIDKTLRPESGIISSERAQNPRGTFAESNQMRRMKTRDFTQKQREWTAKQNQAYLDEMQEAVRDSYDTYDDDIPEAHFHAIPEGLKLSKLVTAEGRSDYVQIMRSVSQKICAVFAVPRSMLINDSVARADTEATHACFRIGLRRYRRHISHGLSLCCSMAYGETLTAYLPDAYYGGTEELLKLYILGAIPYEKYVSVSCDMFNLQHVQGSIDPLTAEERKDIAIECMKSMVTQHHGRT